MDRNWDHLFPRSWYPDAAPAVTFYRWQVPSCVLCSNRFGAIERHLLVRLALRLDPNHRAENVQPELEPGVMGDRADSFRRITEKIVRGITFLEEELYIEPPHTIAFGPFDDEPATVFRERIDQFGREYARAPGIVVLRADGKDEMSALYEIEFFEQYKTQASVEIAGPASN